MPLSSTTPLKDRLSHLSITGVKEASKNGLRVVIVSVPFSQVHPALVSELESQVVIVVGLRLRAPVPVDL